jgi:endonuclease III-like uncharacterized protein
VDVATKAPVPQATGAPGRRPPRRAPRTSSVVHAASSDRLHHIYTQLDGEYGYVPWEWYADDPWYSELKVVVSAVLVQQASWAAAKVVTEKVVRRGLAGILAVAADDLQKMLKMSGQPQQQATSLRALAGAVRAGGGLESFLSQPRQELRDALLGVNGVGEETAATIMLYAARLPVFVVDEYAYRLFRRLGLGPEVEDGNDWRDHYAEWQRYFEAALPHDVELFQRFHAHIVRHCQPADARAGADGGPCQGRELRCGGCCLLGGCSTGLARHPDEALRRVVSGVQLPLVAKIQVEEIVAATLAGRADEEIAAVVGMTPAAVRRSRALALPLKEDQVVRADCVQLMRWMAPASIDAIVSDPPYASDIDKWDRFGGDSFARFNLRWMREAFRVLKPGAYLAAFCSPRRRGEVFMAAADAGFASFRTLAWWRRPGIATQPDWGKLADAALGVTPEVIGQEEMRPVAFGQRRTTGEKRLVTRTRPASEVGKQLAGFRLDLDRWMEQIVLVQRPTATLEPDEVEARFWPYGDEPMICLADRASREERDCRWIANNHRTVKPVAVMDWLVRLVTPPGGLVLDPFCGSGSTLIAAERAGFRYLGADLGADNVHLARTRLREWSDDKLVGAHCDARPPSISRRAERRWMDEILRAESQWWWLEGRRAVEAVLLDEGAAS